MEGKGCLFKKFAGIDVFDIELAEHDPDKLVDAMEKTDYVGTIGRVQFYGKDSEYTHAMKYGKDFVSGTFIQWQSGKQVTVWPTDKANAKIKFPAFVKLPEQHAAK